MTHRSKVLESFERQWTAKEIALECVATISGEKLALFLRLHAFSDDSYSKAFAQGNNGVSNRRIAWIGEDVPHEGLVDFQLIQWKALHAGER